MTSAATRRIGFAAALFAGAVLAQEGLAQAPPPGVFSEIQTAVVARPGTALEPATMRSRVVQVDTQKITAARRGREVLKLNLFDDAVVEIQIKRVRPTSSGYFISGTPRGEEWGEVRLVVNGPVMVGTVMTPEGKFTIRSAGSGRHVIRQVDPSAEPFECEVLDPPPLRPEQAISSIDSPPSLPQPPAPLVDDMPTEDGSEVRILVVYTPALQASQGGAAGMRALVDLMVQSANQAFEDGGISPRLVLAHAALVDYVANKTRTDLSRLANHDDGYMDEVHALRNEHAADLVHLLTNVPIGSVGSAMRLTRESLWSQNGAFAATATTSEQSFTHEVGHNFGLRHDRYVDSPSGALYPYAFGYINLKAFEPDSPRSARWRTVMTYGRGCSEAGIGCSRLLRFSNPDQTYLGDAMGVAADDPATGSDGPADARLTINNSARWVGSFRSQACTDFVFSTATRIAPLDGGEIGISVAAGPGCLWEATSQSEFLKIISDVPGAGHGTVTIKIEANQTGAERSGTLTLAGETITVRQLATTQGICGRSATVMGAIARAAGFSASQCDQVTDDHLARITALRGLHDISVLKEGDFEGLTSLGVLVLQGNELTEVPAGLFADLASLTNLNLSYNEINELPAGLFAGLTRLETLRLNSNNLRELPAGIFDGLSNLQSLELEYNDLIGLPAGVFADLTSLEKLLLNSNELAEYPANLFTGLSRLEILNLSHNRATEVPAGLFTGLSNLEELGLFLNYIAEMPASTFAGLSKLKKLDLGRGQFGTLPAGMFAGLSSLETLNFWDGQLTNLPAGLFSGLTNLQELNFYSNHLSGFPADLFSGLSALERLNLGGNQITSLPSGIFSGLTALEELNLYRNLLSSLPEGAFLGLTALAKLYLGSNRVDPIPLDVSLEKVGASQFKATLSAGAPFALELPVSVGSAGEIAGGAGSLAIPAGAMESAPFGVTRVAGTAEPVDADIGTLPNLPSSHSGYSLMRNATLPRRILGSSLATDATLISLSTSEGTLDPVFAGNTTSYTASVVYATSSITVTPGKSNADATVSYLDGSDQTLADADTTADGHQLSLGVGATTIKIQVAARDTTTTRTYTLVVARDSASGVCARTSQVRDAILAASGVAECADVTESDLSGIANLNLTIKKIVSLKSGDFAGLSGLQTLSLYGNEITSLPADVFAGLAALEELNLGANDVGRLPDGVFSDLTALEILRLDNNNLSILRPEDFSALSVLRDLNLGGNGIGSLPADLFSGLTALETIRLYDNRLRSLPSGLFSGLSRLQDLRLQLNRLSDLPAGVFSGLSALQQLFLTHNSFSSLPAGLFSGLTSLQSLHLGRNPIDPLLLPISLEKVGADQFKVVAPTGLPFSLEVPVSVSSAGEIAGGVNTVTIPAGGVESAPVRVSRISGTTDAVIASIGALPGLPSDHKGYSFEKDESLPLAILAATAPAKDAALRRLLVTGGTLQPEFSPGTNSYAVSIANGVSLITVTPTKSDADATLAYLDADDAEIEDADDNTAGHQVDLSVGESTIKVKVTSQDTTTSRTYTITAKRNSVPEITTEATVSVAENQTAVATLAATDSDADEISWWTNGGADAGRFNLTLDGVLTFASAPDYENPSDLDGDNVYVLVAQASDGADDAFLTLAVTVTDVDPELPPPNDDASLSGLSLNDGTLDPVFSSGTTSYTTLVANGVSRITVTASKSDTNATLAYLDADDSALADADSGTEGHQVNLSVGENTFKVKVTAGDTTTMQTYTLVVTRNSLPQIATTSPVSVAENETAVATLAATDADGGDISWSTNGGADEDKFDLTVDGVLTFSSAPDYEHPADADADNEYVLIVRATDGTDTSDLTLRVSVTDVDESTVGGSRLSALSLSDGTLDPVFASGVTSYTATVANGVSSITVTPTRSDATATLAYLDGADAELDDADDNTAGHQVDLSVGENTFKVKVTAEDTTTSGTYTIVVTRNRLPEITTSSPVFVAENETAVATLAATDADGDDISWTTSGGADEDKFDLTVDGVLAFASAPDYEHPADADTNNEYVLIVRAADGTDTADLTVTVKVTDVDDSLSNDTRLSGLSLSDGTLDPVFASGVTSYAATVANGVSSITVTPTGSDANATLAYLDGADAELADADDNTAGQQADLSVGENTVKVKVTAENTVAMRTYTIVVTRNRLPEITTSSPVSVAENQTAVATLAATDADGDDISWSTNGGADENKFDLTAEGVLTFASAPDYEAPSDADTDNEYVVVVRAGDGTGSTELTLTVKVTDTDDAPSDDAALSALSLSVGTLSPAFAPGVTGYTAPVTNGVSSITVTPTTSDSNATVAYLDGGDAELADADDNTAGHQVELSVGENTIKIRTTAEDTTTTRTYTIVVTRQVATDVCERTEQVRDAIVAAVEGVDACKDVTTEQLSAITGLDVSGESLSSLQSGDFDGMTKLVLLKLNDNSLSSLQSDIFSGLTELDTLELESNQLSSLPSNLFSDLADLKVLLLGGNRLSALPSDVFSGVSNLQRLQLEDNELTGLPASLFFGLSSLVDLDLGGNSVDPLPLTVSLEKVGSSEFKAVALTGAPFGLELPVSASSAGEITGGANSVTIPSGKGESAPVGVTRVSGTKAAVTVDIGTLPGVPALHSGYSLTKGNNLPIEILPVVLSDDADLSALSLSDGTLDPVFASGVTSYTATVANGVSSITVTPTRSDATATLAYLDGADAELDDADDNTAGHQVDLSVGENTVRVKVTAEDTTTPRTYTIVVTRNRLPEITTSSPVFVAENETAVATLAATDADGDDINWTTSGGADEDKFDLTVDGVLAFASAPDYEHPADADTNNEYVLIVRAADGTDTADLTVTVKVTDVDDSLSNDTRLSGLSLSDGTLDPVFASGVTSYAATVANGVSSITVTPTRSDATATLAYLDGADAELADADDNTAGHQADLSVGENTVKVKVTAEDTVTMRTYTVVVTRNSATSTVEGICGRTKQVRDAIVAAISSVDACEDVTATHLSGVGSLDLSDESISSLDSDDFDGLTALTELNLDSNEISNLPSDIFSGLASLTSLKLRINKLATVSSDLFSGLTALELIQLGFNDLTAVPSDLFSGLTSLTEIELAGNDLTTVPSGLFSDNTALQRLWLHSNQLSSLPSDIFSGLTSLRTLLLSINELTSLPSGIFSSLTSLYALSLGANDLEALPADIFSGLPRLTQIDLDGNQLEALPDGIFSGLIAANRTGLTNLDLEDNPGAPFSISISLEEVGTSQFKVVIPKGAPFTMEVPLSASSDGGIEDDADAVSMVGGSIESEPVGVTRVTGTTTAVTVDIGTLPELPGNHKGYVLEKDSSLPLAISSPTESTPTGYDDATLSGLSLSSGTLDPVFASATTNYEASVSSTVSSITVTPTTTGSGSTTAYLDSSDATLEDADTDTDGQQVDLLMGKNTIKVQVTAQDTETTETYTVVVTRGAATGVCARTEQVRDAILARITGVDACEDVTGAQLAGIGALSLSNANLKSLQSGDFAGLTRLTFLSFSFNDLTSLPSDLFAGLTALESLDFVDNDIGNLPAGIFSGLSALKILLLGDNPLGNLPAGIFSGLSALEELECVNCGISSLPANLFSGLGALQDLSLSENELSSLPDGIFSGLNSLSKLKLARNSVDPLALPLSLEKVGESQFKAVVPTGAPFAMDLPVSVSSDGAIEGDADSVTIAAGVLESSALTVTRMSGTTGAVTVDIGTLPSLPEDHAGYALEKDSTLPLEVLSEETSTAPATGVCARTEQVRDAIVAAVSGVDACEDVTSSHLSELFTLNLFEQDIASLDSGDFGGLTNLRYLGLRENRLESVPADVFSGLTMLHTLELSNNNLSSLSSSQFSGLTNLETLQLWNNKLSSLPSNLFSGLTRLETLGLSANELSSLPSGIFAGLAELTELDLAVNRFSSFSENAFANLTELTELELERNQLGSLAENLFDGLTRLEYLSLHQNELTNLPEELFDGLSALEDLYLNQNRLTTLAEDIFDGLISLEGLELGGNQLNALPEEVFDGLAALEGLGLNQNRLASLPAELFDGLTTLRQLTINGNQVTSLPEDIFDGLSALKFLSLSSNSLTALPADVFDNLTILTNLGFADNDISSLPEDIFSDLTALDTLGFGGNELSALPDGVFSGLTALQNVWLAGNTVDPLPIIVSLEKVGSSQFKAIAPVGAPFDLVLPVSVSSDGEIEDGAGTVTISTGAVESAAVAVTRVDGAQGAITVGIGALPRLPINSHNGYSLEKDDSLLLEVLPAQSNATEEGVAVDASYADVNRNGTIEADDVMLMYHAFESASQLGDGETGGTSRSRQILLAGLASAPDPTDDELREMLGKANQWREVGVEVGGDINGDGVIDSDDALAMYYAFEFENLVGDGEAGGAARFRRSLLAAFATQANPTDENLKAMLRRANKLREDFG